MATIVSNYIDIGFGSSTIDYSTLPFNNITNTNYSSEGFGNPNFIEINTTGNINKYYNQKTLNFGSSELSLSQNFIKYDYEEIYERGSEVIDENDFKIIKIKNKNIFNPIFVCTPNKQTLVADLTLSIEKVNFNSFKVFNDSDIKIKVDYIATATIAIKKNISVDQFVIDRLNKKNNFYLYNS